MTISIFDELRDLEQERYRAIILHAIPEKGPAMSQFCQKVCRQINGKYLDLLEHFINQPQLSEKIDSFSPEKFKLLLMEQSQGESLLLIDRADFLLDTWRKAERHNFFRILTNQWDGYKEGMQAKLMIVLQTSQDIRSLKMLDSQGQSRIFQLNDFSDIE
jgi:hypothetical protein